MSVFKYFDALDEKGSRSVVKAYTSWSMDEDEEQLKSLNDLFYYDGLKFEGVFMLGVEQDINMFTWVFVLQHQNSDQDDWRWNEHDLRKKFERWIDEWWDDESRFHQQVAVNIGDRRVVISHFQEE